MWPTFIIIGAQRSGTTSLYHYMRQHPGVHMSPVKETNFFAIDDRMPALEERTVFKTSVSDVPSYRALFEEGDGKQALGEASPAYLNAEDAPRRMAQCVPHAKLIAVLRNPIDRAYSRFLQAQLKGREDHDTFEEALDKEAQLLERGAWKYWEHGFVPYLDGGMYAKHLERYWAHYPKDQVGVWLHDDLRQDAASVCAEVFEFIGVDPSYEVQTERYNASGVPKNAWLDRAIRAGRNAAPSVKRLVRQWMPDSLYSHVRSAHNRNFEKPQMKSGTRAHLAEVFRPDVERLGQLLGRDLSHWLAP
ncbi:MAG: sulfotransferase domain-containing protein [Bacteroidota bacterium]